MFSTVRSYREALGDAFVTRFRCNQAPDPAVGLALAYVVQRARSKSSRWVFFFISFVISTCGMGPGISKEGLSSLCRWMFMRGESSSPKAMGSDPRYARSSRPLLGCSCPKQRPHVTCAVAFDCANAATGLSQEPSARLPPQITFGKCHAQFAVSQWRGENTIGRRNCRWTATTTDKNTQRRPKREAVTRPCGRRRHPRRSSFRAVRAIC